MLSLRVKSGEYLKIGEDVTVQVFGLSDASFRVVVQAPKEILVLRGEVLERSEERPEHLYERRPQSPAQRVYNARHSADKVKGKPLPKSESMQK